jgi:PAS domain-containing protein
MSQQQNQVPFFNYSTGSINELNNFGFNFNSQQEDVETTKPPRKRRDDTNSIVEQLYKATLIQRPGERDAIRTGGRKNKNEVLGSALARLIKEKHLNGVKYSNDIELLQGIQTKSNNDEFVLVLRTDGRIVVMSDEVEHHLGKSMRSLYTQCINIFECLDETDGNKLQSILNSSTDLTHQEYRLVCTFRLPKGKRPSRKREDVKTITMAGHFYSCHESSTSSERLFIARCEALVSRTTNRSSSSQTSTITNNSDNINSMIKLTLNDDMLISLISSNVKDILGYSRSEMIGNWLGRYLTTNDLEKFEAIRQRYFQLGQQQATNICEIFDIYTNNGDGRLTFLCQIRPIRERRSKTIKFAVVAQLIDPSLRSEYVKYVEVESETNPKPIKAEQVNFASSSSSTSKTSEDTIMANSPSLAMGLLMFDNTFTNEVTHQQQHSPFNRSLSNVVAPINVDDQSWQQLFDFDYDQYPTTTDLQYWPTKSFEDAFVECQSEQGLRNVFDDYFDEYFMNGGCS